MKKYGMPTKRELAGYMNYQNKSIRKTIDASTKKKVLERANNKCERCKKKKEAKLQFHHKNMINQDNRVSNIKAYCPDCHTIIHREFKVKHTKDMMGVRLKSRVVKTKKKVTKKKKTTQNKLWKVDINLGKMDFGSL